jgi:hypothetical protein
LDNAHIVGYLTSIRNAYIIYNVPQKNKKTGGTPTVKQVLLKLPEDLHYSLKLRAVEEKTNIRAFIGALIRQALERPAEVVRHPDGPNVRQHCGY